MGWSVSRDAGEAEGGSGGGEGDTCSRGKGVRRDNSGKGQKERKKTFF